MKKLFAPVLVLTLIVGFSALALGATQASDSQTLTVNIQKAYSITAPGSKTVTVGPNTTASVTSQALKYKLNDEATSSIDVAVSGTDFAASGIDLTFDVTALPPGSPGGVKKTNVVVNSSTSSGTLIGNSTSFNAGDYSATGATFDITFGTVDWSYASSNSLSLTAVYKILAA